MSRYKYAILKLHSFAEECSVIGVRQAMDSNRHLYRRIIWVVLVTAGFGLAMFQIQDRIACYAGFPTTTNVRINQAPFLPFPQVTICDENKMRLSVAKSLGESVSVCFHIIILVKIARVLIDV